MALAALPVLSAFLPNRIFYIRDLSLYFWPRYLWLRRTLLSGEWPLWDPFLATGQSAVADALHQMFLLPALLLRLIGSERIGFNLWVAAPFPIAALGMFSYLRARFAAHAAVVGAIAFSLCGPVVSTGNFPNLSWSVAGMPWVLWAADRCVDRGGRGVATLAVLFALQALAGEPVTLTATAALVIGHAVALGSPRGQAWLLMPALRGTAVAAVGLALGGLLAAIQLLPLAGAVADSWRVLPKEDWSFWSLHPLGLAEAVAVHLFGDYFTTPHVQALPWMPVVNGGREPLFFSIYFGPTLLALAALGAAGAHRKRYSVFWVGACVVGVVAAAGPYTPVYPFLRTYVPLLASFRFPVKYLVVAAVGVAALAAAAWDAIADERRRLDPPAAFVRGRWIAVMLAGSLAVVGYLAAAAAMYFPELTARAFYEAALLVRMPDPIAGAAFLLRRIPPVATRLVLLSLAAALFLAVAASRRREAGLGRAALLFLLATDLVVAAWPINPTTDASIMDEPAWVSTIRPEPDATFYFGGKTDGTFDPSDPEAPPAFLQPPDMSPGTARSAINNQGVFYPGGRGLRELFSYDLAVLWPRAFKAFHERFLQAPSGERRRFLDRMGVRYRVLPTHSVQGYRQLASLPFFLNVGLFDFGVESRRVEVLTAWAIEPDLEAQIERLFQHAGPPLVMLAAPPPPGAGLPGAPAATAARITKQSSNTVVVEASTGAQGGILRLLDSYSPDWHVTVDGHPAPLLRADVLFRGVALAPGRHTVLFRYRPRMFYYGVALSALALLLCLLLNVRERMGRGRSRLVSRWRAATAEPRRAEPAEKRQVT